MDVKYSREVAVGTIVLIAIGIFIFGTMWLSGRSLSPGDDYLQIRFANAAGLKEGSPVRVSGVPVGRIERIQLLEAGDVRAWISVPERIVPMSDASAEIVPVGLVGDYAIDFTPGASTTPLDRETVIQGGRETGLSEMAEVLGSRADTVLLGMQAFTSAEMAENFRLTLMSMQQTLDGLSRSLPSTTRQANETMASLQRLSDQLAGTLGSPGFQNTLTNFDSLSGSANLATAQLNATLRSLDTLLAAVNGGRGTLGLLATDSTLYWNLVGASGQLDSLIANLKEHPGRIQVIAPIKVF